MQHGRDVIGLSPKATARVKAAAWKRWEAWKAGRYKAQAEPGPAKAPMIPQVGNYDTTHATFGIGATGPEKFAQGRWTGGDDRAGVGALLPAVGRGEHPPSDDADEVPASQRRLDVQPAPRPRLAGERAGRSRTQAPLRRARVKPPGPARVKVAMPPKPPAAPAPAAPLHPIPAIARALEIGGKAGVRTVALDARQAAIKWPSEDIRKRTAAVYNPEKGTIYINATYEGWQDPVAWLTGKGTWYSTHHKDHWVWHELGHHFHWLGIGKDLDRFKAVAKSRPPDLDLVRQHVSGYAAQSDAEFVAEVYVGLKAGKQYPRALIDHYLALGGPRK